LYDDRSFGRDEAFLIRRLLGMVKVANIAAEMTFTIPDDGWKDMDEEPALVKLPANEDARQYSPVLDGCLTRPLGDANFAGLAGTNSHVLQIGAILDNGGLEALRSLGLGQRLQSRYADPKETLFFCDLMDTLERSALFKEIENGSLSLLTRVYAARRLSAQLPGVV
jgi:hypothetical protein